MDKVCNMRTCHSGTATFLWEISSPVPTLKSRWTWSLHGWRWWDETIQICVQHPEIKEKAKVKMMILWTVKTKKIIQLVI